MEQSKLVDAIGNHLGFICRAQENPDFFSVREHVDSLSVKREAFSHECEVRVIYVDEERRFENRPHIQVPVDANTIIENITLDPRLSVDQDVTRKELLANMGFRGEIEKSQLYSPLVVQVMVDKPIVATTNSKVAP